MKQLLPLLICFVLFSGCRDQTENTTEVQDTVLPENEPITVQIAKANGFEEFKEVKQINFTFNVKSNDTLRTSRAWKWYPQDNRVELAEKEDTIEYENDGDFNEAELAADRKFINDTYWLIFPYHLVWSEYKMDHQETAEAPISKEQMQKLTISFEGDGGYTPGDTYHIYFKDDKLIQEWTYESSGGRSLSTTWEDYEEFNGIKIAKMHQTEDESFQLFFTDIEVTK